MAHNLARHQGEKISSNFVVSIIAALSLLIDPSGNFLTIFMPAAKLFSELPNSRLHESEADQIGMRLAAEACYDPEAMSRVFRRMDEAGKDRSDQNLAVKPPNFSPPTQVMSRESKICRNGFQKTRESSICTTESGAENFAEN